MSKILTPPPRRPQEKQSTIITRNQQPFSNHHIIKNQLKLCTKLINSFFFGAVFVCGYSVINSTATVMLYYKPFVYNLINWGGGTTTTTQDTHYFQIV